EVARCVRLADRGSASIKWSRRALDRLRECAGRDHPAYLQARHELALGLAAAGEAEDGLDELDGAIATMIAAGESRELASALRDRGSIQAALGQDDDARRSFERALAAFERLDGEESVGAACVLLERGKLACRAGELVIAAADLGRAERILEARCGERDLRTAAALAALGELRRVEGRTSDADQLLGRALEAIESARGRSSPEARAVRVELARVAHARGDEARATSLLAASQVGRRDLETALARVEVARALRDRHDERRAERLEADALAAAVPRRALLLAAFGSLSLAQGDPRAAERSLALALEQAREDVDSKHPALADLLDDLARARRANGSADVKALLERAVSIRDDQRRRLELALGDEHEDLAPILEKLAIERRELGEDTVARGLERRAAEIRRGKKK
ncbi:MAG TPA: hypothetical protein VFF73_20400, partial [Planctomycetota bacterium]|nr:hypothetical protein [Planctomycetota bacterium]